MKLYDLKTILIKFIRKIRTSCALIEQEKHTNKDNYKNIP